MFMNIGGMELLVIALVALIIVGPEQLPGMMRRVGHFVAQVRDMSNSMKDEFMGGMDRIDPTTWESPDTESTLPARSDQQRARGTGGENDPIVPRGYSESSGAEPHGIDPDGTDPEADPTDADPDEAAADSDPEESESDSHEEAS